MKAGERAMTQLAWETALQHYERALHAIDLQGVPDPAQRCDVLLALGSTQYHAVLDVSESPEGRSSFLQAAEIARSIASPERLAHAALQFAGLNVVRTAGGAQQVQLLEEALALVAEDDSALRARLLARLAIDYRVIPGKATQTAAMSDAALAMARRLGDPSVLAFVLIARRVAIWGPDNLDERLALTAEAEKIADDATDPYLAMWRHIFSAIDRYEAGDNQGVDREVDAFVEAARRSRAPYFLWASEINQAGRAIKEGRFAEAEASVPTLGGTSQALVAVYFRTLLLFLMRREQDRLHELEEPLRVVIELTRDAANPFDRHRGHVAQAMLMILLAEAGRADEARSRFEAFTSQDVADIPKDSYWLATVVLLADVCVLLGDRERALQLDELLRPYAARNAAPGSGPVFLGAVSFYRGRLASLLSRWDDAARHFDEALSMNLRMRARPALADTQYAYADMLLRRDGTDEGDRERALSLLGEALGVAEELGMTRLAERALALKVQAQGILKA
jgi:tetratricopeptide (TPR) repeat protein